MKRILLIFAGFASLSLGIVGIFLPLLPTTPFLLLSAACFFKSSDKLYQWLTTHPWFGSDILFYKEFHAITLRSKIIAIIFLWGTIGFSILYIASTFWLQALLFIIAIGVTIHLLHFKTLTKEMMKGYQKHH